MKTNKIKYIVFLLLIISIIGCKKDNNNPV